MKNEKGFAHILFLSALPFLLGVFLLMYFWIGVLQTEAKIRYLCRKEQIAAQERSRNYLDQLLKKNSLARQLKIQLQLAEAALAAALVTGNPPAIEAAKIRLDQVKFRRAALDLTQKTLVHAASMDLRLTALKLTAQLQRESIAQKSLLSVLLDIQLQIPTSGVPNLAVTPSYPDIAPEYRTQDSFSERQALEQRWQYRVRIATPLNRFMRGEATFKKESRITLAGEIEKWRIENLKDKSW